MSKTFKLINLSGVRSFDGGHSDLEIAPSGSVVLLEKTDAIAQLFEKGILTILGTNLLHSEFGTRIRELLGGKMTSNVSAGLSAVLCENLIRTLMTYQQKYAGSVDISKDETIVGLSGLTISFFSSGKLQLEASVKTLSSVATSVTTFEGVV